MEARAYAKLLGLAALLGLVTGVITFAFIALVNLGQNLIWQQAASVVGLPTPLFTLVICLLGGLLVGLLVRGFGDHTGIFAELMQEFGKTGRFDYRNAPGIVVTAFVSLLSGASLGPEAPLADASGGLGTWLSDRLKLGAPETRTLGFSGVSGMLAAFVTSPVGGAMLGLESAQGSAVGTTLYLRTLFPSLVASAVATVAFVALSGKFFGSLYTFPQYEPRFLDLLRAVPLGLIGGLVGIVFFLVLRRLQALMRPLRNHPIPRGLIGGLGLGIAGALLPLTLFSGEVQTQDIINQAAQLGALLLVVLAVVKLLITCLGLATGWKGGYIFPIMFIGAALGLAASDLFPDISPAVAVAATMGGAMVATMRAPLFSILFTLVLTERQTAPVTAIAVVAAALLAAVLSIVTARRESVAAKSSEP
jgi:H+/Cl- antiporter ClcA